MSRVLIIAPHPDDEVLGCGGTIKKWSDAGNEIHLCVVTKAYTPEWSEEFLKNRPKEIEAANAVLGVKETHLIDFPTVKLDTIPQKELNKAILKIVQEIQPAVVFIPHHGDLMKDHRLVHEAALVAVRPHQNDFTKKILAYEIPSETEWGISPFVPNVYEDISETLQAKIKAMECYPSELKAFPHPRSLEVIEALAKKRGSEAGFVAAEAFILIRELAK